MPGNYQVWATGDLKNTDEVYNAPYAKRIRDAEKSDSVIDIIAQNDIAEGNISKGNKVNTWKFEADNVTDFAFTVSNHYLWKSCSLIVDAKTGRRVRADAVYNPNHKAYNPVIGYARKTVEAISYKFPAIAFPYAHITVFDGLDAMEYPMMINDLPFENPADAIEFTAHEIFHSLFPFYVGTNETKYSFMDEGWATLAEFMLHPVIDPTVAPGNNVADVNRSAGNEQDVPIMTLTPQLYGSARYADKDMKPALGYLYVKEALSDKLFFKSLRYYIDQWKGKHPTPYDFFDCMNTASGVNLNWFWQNWFFEKGVPNLAIGKVWISHQQLRITIKNLGSEAIPVHLNIYYKDGTKSLVSKSVTCWQAGNKSIILKLYAKKPVSKLVLGTAFDADIDPKNNNREF